MNRKSNTSVAVVVAIIVLAVLALGCVVGGVFLAAGWFLYESTPELLHESSAPIDVQPAPFQTPDEPAHMPEE